MTLQPIKTELSLCIIKDEADGPICGDPKYVTLTTDYLFSDGLTYTFEFPMCLSHAESMRGRLDDLKMERDRVTHPVTPEYIAGPDELPEGSVFVFGSNTEGIHGTGSASTAINEFGAIWGKPYGRQGASYAICTTDLTSGDRYPLHLIEEHIEEFLNYALANPEETFWVTKIGSLRAGYTIEDMAALWEGKNIPQNVVLPVEYI